MILQNVPHSIVIVVCDETEKKISQALLNVWVRVRVLKLRGSVGGKRWTAAMFPCPWIKRTNQDSRHYATCNASPGSAKLLDVRSFPRCRICVYSCNLPRHVLTPIAAATANMRSSVTTAMIPPQKSASRGFTVKAAEKQHEPQHNKDNEHDHFFWTYTEEPHKTRRMAIIKAHPEVLQNWTSSFLEGVFLFYCLSLTWSR
jgi:hypothetical protein